VPILIFADFIYFYRQKMFVMFGRKKKYRISFLLVAVIPLSLIFLRNTPVPETKIKTQTLSYCPDLTNYATSWADSVFNTLSPDERIGQLFMVASYPKQGAENKAFVTKIIKDYKIGGLIMFQSGPVAQAKLTNYYQSISKVPLMIAGDYEWGLSMRLDSTVNFPRQMPLGAIQNDRTIYEFGAEVARQCRRMGIHINFAPVIDVNNNPANPVINSRSFGENKKNVAKKGALYMSGLQDKRILAVGKHFPGHGDTDVDSHHELPTIPHQFARLNNVELFPFKYLINHGLGGVMMAHLHIPNLDSATNSISSLSYPTVTGLLKQKLDFKGLVFTDALGMQGVTKYHAPGETEVKAILAGVDILLMPRNVPEAFIAIKKAIADGLITQNEIDIRVRKILAAKKWFGLDNYKPIEIKNLHESLNAPAVKLLRRKLIEQSMTLALNKDELIPIKKLDTVSIASLSISSPLNNSFQQRLSDYADVKHFSIEKTADAATLNRVFLNLIKSEVVIIGIHNTNNTPPFFGVNQANIDFIEKLAERTKVVVALFGNPYALAMFKKPEKLYAVIVAYNDWSENRDFAAQLIFGGIRTDAELPVSAGNLFKAGMGETEERIRMKYSVPEELKMKTEKLKSADSVILKAIELGAMPGASIMALKDGIVFYQKSFGTHTYKSKRINENTDIYDLASVTKVSASLPAIMLLYENNKLSLNEPISKYLPETAGTNKANMTLRSILAHQARLKPWIPFYLKTYSDKSKLILDTAIYATSKSEKYPLTVAENLYITKAYSDSLYKRIYDSGLESRVKYKYSDLGFYMIYRMVENISGEKFDDFLNQNFYSSLGATTLGFKPFQRFEKDRCVPTEDDTKYRKQLLQGYVHDYGAAMTGCVNGHAGLFATANDLAKLMQMYLQKGEYGGERYLKEETVTYFTSRAYKKGTNIRALGFDRMEASNEMPSQLSYGHSGFTGTYVWVDPEYGLVYIFLSNRIHPNIENPLLSKLGVRGKVLNFLYEALPSSPS